MKNTIAFSSVITIYIYTLLYFTIPNYNTNLAYNSFFSIIARSSQNSEHLLELDASGPIVLGHLVTVVCLQQVN